MKIKCVTAALALLALASGCVSYEYKGESGGAPTEAVAVFMSSVKIRRPYQVLGEATVSGDYRDISRDRLMNKLISPRPKRTAPTPCWWSNSRCSPVAAHRARRGVS